jgi:Na+-transporting NADH:ubiquinone oxidoreductase subunit A
MSKVIKLRKGFTINLAGRAELKVAGEVMPETFAIKPTDFHGIQRPKVLVKEGDTVKAGTPILYDKANPKVQIVAPVSGEIAEVVRGAKRKLLEIRILADRTVAYEEFPKLSSNDVANLQREEVVELLAKSGAWPNLVQRPYGIIASPDETPKAIFISSFDTHPLAPDYDFLLRGQERYFQAGIDLLRKLTDGPVHIGLNADAEVSPVFTSVKGATQHKFSGKHPVGNVGVQIHHIDPINKGDIVWTINPYGVAQIGKLLVDGRYDSSKLVAVVGSEVKEPHYVKTWGGANVGKLLAGKIKQENVRYVSGNVLTGTNVGKDGYLGYFDNMVTILPEGNHYEFLGWLTVTPKKYSYHRAFGLLSFLNRSKPYVIDTNLQGEERAWVQTGTFDNMIPMDIMPEYLLKSIMAEDYDGMESLGIYEVIEEDMALCEFIDVSKHDVQAILREGLTLMQYS